MKLYHGTTWRRLCRNRPPMRRASNKPVKAGIAVSRPTWKKSSRQPSEKDRQDGQLSARQPDADAVNLDGQEISFLYRRCVLGCL